MLFGKRRKYVMLPQEGASAQAPQPAVVSEDAAAARVVYRLDTIVSSVAGAVCVVGYGNAMKAVVKACRQVGCEKVWVTGTDDKKRAFSCSGSASVVSLGPTFDQRLFSNDYAIMQAAHSCGAGALLVIDEQVAHDVLLQELAHAEGLMLFTPLPGDKTMTSWIKCEPAPGSTGNRSVEWRGCPTCKLKHDVSEVMTGGGVCPTCGGLYRLTSDERIAQTFDEGTFEEWFAVVPETDPLAFPDYDSLLEGMRRKSGLSEAVRCGKAALAGIDVALCVMESTFMMGSMGSVVGEKITRTIERATREGLPLVIFTASGGARMQEGLVSLMQMAKISAAVERHGEAGLVYVSVITDPTTGGVTASFAMQGDIIVSEPYALIGFAGRRVIQDTIRQTLPDGFQTAEFALEHGLIDAIVQRAEMRSYLAHVIALHVVSHNKRRSGLGGDIHSYHTVEESLNGRMIEHSSVQVKRSIPTNPLSAAIRNVLAAPGRAARGIATRSEEGSAEKEKAFVSSGGSSIRRAMSKRGVADAPGVKPMMQTTSDQANPAWESVLLARNVHRPTAQYYIDAVVDGFLELHGDRSFADDAAILAGVGWIDGQPVTVIAEEKGSDLNQRIARNFGCPQPEGYRKSLRLMRQAEKFGRPVVCFVDTQGAFCGMEAEERGQGNAIADNLVALAGLKVPVVCVVLGEGGSGGALALALGNRVAMQEHAVYSVLSPEGFASILWKDRSRAAEAAAVMKMSAAEACEMGIVEEVLSEGEGPAHENPVEAAREVADFVIRSLRELESLDVGELLQQRYDRFRAF